MKFKEHLIPTPESTVFTTGISSDFIETANENCRHLIVRLLPSYPFQYLPHRELMSLIVSEVIQTIQEKCRIERIIFIIGTSKKRNTAYYFHRLPVRRSIGNPNIRLL